MKKVLCIIFMLLLLINTAAIAERIEFNLVSSESTSELIVQRLLKTAGIITMIGFVLGISGQLFESRPTAELGWNVAFGASLCFVANLGVYGITLARN